MRTRQIVALAVLVAAALAMVLWLAAGAYAEAYAAADQPPECVSVAVHAYQAPGGFTTTWLEFCGGHPGGDSALHDWAQGRRFTLDGATAIGRGCGAKASPCVLFPGP